MKKQPTSDPLENTMRHLPIMLTLLPEATFSERSLNPKGQWTVIGRDAYQRGPHGVFKLEIWSGGTYGAFVGLSGIYIAYQGGKVDDVTFRFDDLLEPNYEKCTNTNVRKPSQLSIFAKHHEAWHWYCGLEPKSLKPLHTAIRQWCGIWSTR